MFILTCVTLKIAFWNQEINWIYRLINALIRSQKGCSLPIWASKIDTRNCLQYSTSDGSQQRTIPVLAYTLEQYTPSIKNFSSERLTKSKTHLSSSASIIRSLSFSRLNRCCSTFLQSGWRYLNFLIFWWFHIATLLWQWLPRCGVSMREGTTAIFYLGLRGRLAFAVSIPREQGP